MKEYEVFASGGEKINTGCFHSGLNKFKGNFKTGSYFLK